jgi:tryptophan 7-halogenase
MSEAATLAIVGDGVTAWTAAGLLGARLPRERYRVLVIPEPEPAPDEFGPALATLPTTADLHAGLGIDEAALLRRCAAGMSLGQALAGWQAPGSAAFLPHGPLGAPLGPVAFHQLAARLRAEGQAVRLSDYALAALAAQAGRFTRPSDDPRSVLSHFAHALHLETGGYRALLQSRAAPAAAPLATVRRDAEGGIASLSLADGSSVDALLYLDCTGARARLIGELSGVESWQAALPCDRTATALLRDDGAPLPYAIAEALPHGWRHTLPLHGGVAECFLWSSAHGDGPEGLAATAFAPGRRAEPWSRNCIALGAAAATLDPLHPHALHLVHAAIARLLALFPRGPEAPLERTEYNRQTTAQLDRARDAAAALYRLNRRPEPFWQSAAAAEPSEPLAAKLALFESRGRVVMYDEEVLEEEDWVALFDAQGLRQRRYDALADAVPIERIQGHLSRLREAIIGAVRAMPTHADYLRSAA